MDITFLIFFMHNNFDVSLLIRIFAKMDNSIKKYERNKTLLAM